MKIWYIWYVSYYKAAMITSLYHSPSKFLHPAPLDHKVVLSSPPTISVTSSAPMVANEGQEMQPKTDGSQNSKKLAKTCWNDVSVWCISKLYCLNCFETNKTFRNVLKAISIYPHLIFYVVIMWSLILNTVMNCHLSSYSPPCAVTPNALRKVRRQCCDLSSTYHTSLRPCLLQLPQPTLFTTESSKSIAKSRHLFVSLPCAKSQIPWGFAEFPLPQILLR